MSAALYDEIRDDIADELIAEPFQTPQGHHLFLDWSRWMVLQTCVGQGGELTRK